MNGTDWLAVVDEIGPAFAEGVAERDASDTFAANHYTVLKDKGFVSAMVPTSFGGGGATHAEMCGVLRRLATYDGSIALALSMHQHLVAAQVFNHVNGRPAPVLAKVADGKLVLVSTGARDWLQSNGTLTKVDGGYQLSARKAFASGSPAGDIAVTSAQYEAPDDGPQVLHFAVPMKAPGVRLEIDWKAHGMRATGSNTIVFEDVFVPDAAIALARPRDEFPMIWNVVIGVALPLIMSAYVGVAEKAAATALPYGERRATTAATQWAAGEMLSNLFLAQACLDQMIALTNDWNFAPSIDLSNRMLALKTHTADAVQRVCECAIETAGGAGYYRRTGLERLLRDARAAQFHPLARKPQIEFAGRVALGLPPVAL